MIKSYADKDTRKFAEGQRVKKFSGFEGQAERKLALLHGATKVGQLGHVPGSNLEKLKGDRKGQYSIRVNRQWRLCFTWDDGDENPSDVEIVDYH